MVYDVDRMYRVYIVNPTIHERVIYNSRGITTMCFTMIETMYFASKEDAHTYMETIKTLYSEFRIKYKVYHNIDD